MTCFLYWLTGFRGEDFKTFFPIGSYVKTMSAEGGHLVYDHPMNISAKFGSNLFCGFRKKDENVKFP
jgi:hypothetical protein